MWVFKNDTVIAYKKLIFENGDVIHMHIICSQSVALPNDTANYWPGIRNAAFKSFFADHFNIVFCTWKTQKHIVVM